MGAEIDFEAAGLLGDLDGKAREARLALLQDLAVVPLLVDADDTVLAAGDRLLSAGFDAWLRSHDARLQWSPAPH